MARLCGAHRGPGFFRKMSGLEAIWSGHAPTKFRDRAGRRNKSGHATLARPHCAAHRTVLPVLGTPSGVHVRGWQLARDRRRGTQCADTFEIQVLWCYGVTILDSSETARKLHVGGGEEAVREMRRVAVRSGASPRGPPNHHTITPSHLILKSFCTGPACASHHVVSVCAYVLGT